MHKRRFESVSLINATFVSCKAFLVFLARNFLGMEMECDGGKQSMRVHEWKIVS